MLYICDPIEHREATRDSLYKHWFNGYSRRAELTLRAEAIDFEGCVIYTGMILRKEPRARQPY